MSYERYREVLSKEKYFEPWKPEIFVTLSEPLKEDIYKKYVLKCAVFVRDNFKCQNEKCLNPEINLTLHHIKWQKNGGEDKIKNGVTICKNCHNSFHKGRRELTFWGMTYKIHMEATSAKANKAFKKEKKLLRKAFKEYHGYKISWEMVRILMACLDENYYETMDDD